MSRYRGPKIRVTRRLGDLPGFTTKTTTRVSRPGQHGAGNRKLSEYGLRLEEKQKLRYNYGLTERQLLNYVKKAKRSKVATGEALLKVIESRLDNVVYRAGMANTIPGARQLVSHGHIKVNGKRVTIASYLCEPGDTISVAAKSDSQKLVKEYYNFPGNSKKPTNLKVDESNLSVVYLSPFERDDVGVELKELYVVEYYSRKV